MVLGSCLLCSQGCQTPSDWTSSTERKGDRHPGSHVRSANGRAESLDLKHRHHVQPTISLTGPDSDQSLPQELVSSAPFLRSSTPGPTLLLERSVLSSTPY